MKRLLDQVKLRHGAVLANRIVQPPMQSFSGKPGGYPSEETFQYYQRRNESAGMIIAEYHYVSPEGNPASRVGYKEPLAVFSDDHLQGLSQLAQVIKEKGSKAILQIHHGGARAQLRGEQHLPIFGPSALQVDFLPHPVEELDLGHIRQIVGDFANATRRAIQAGFDGVEIHGANHYLIHQFFSKSYNQRQDNYGGSLEKRMTFALEVTQAIVREIEAKAPAGFILGYRLSPEEIHQGKIGFTTQEALQLVQELNQFKLDYLHLSLRGPIDQAIRQSDQLLVPSFKQVLDPETQLVSVGGIANARMAQEALDYTDLIAIGKGILIEPDFAKKIQLGQEEAIRSRIEKETFEDLAWPKDLKRVFLEAGASLGALPGMEQLK